MNKSSKDNQYLFIFGWNLAIPTNCFSLTSDIVMGILKSFMNSYNIRAVPFQSSYWTE